MVRPTLWRLLMRRRSLFAAVFLVSLVPASGVVRAQVGWADLHDHPASHLAFGHDDPTFLCPFSDGVFHGAPGLAWDPTNDCALLLPDLQECDPVHHAMCPDPDPIRTGERAQILQGLENRLNMAHGPDGHPGFTSWPNALSRIHQQMHVQWLRRAYEGGLRLMIASVTDNELLADYYHDDSLCTGVFRPAAGQNFNSAVRQIQRIRDIEAANSSWMKIALNPAEAQGAMANGKLVIILG